MSEESWWASIQWHMSIRCWGSSWRLHYPSSGRKNFLMGTKAAALFVLNNRSSFGGKIKSHTQTVPWIFTYHLGDACGDVGFGGIQGALVSFRGCWFIFNLDETVVWCNLLLPWDWVGLLFSALWNPCKREIWIIKPNGYQRNSDLLKLQVPPCYSCIHSAKI